MPQILVNGKKRRHEAKRVLDNQEVIGKYVGDSSSDLGVVYIDNSENLHACYKSTLRVIYVDGSESNG